MAPTILKTKSKILNPDLKASERSLVTLYLTSFHALLTHSTLADQPSCCFSNVPVRHCLRAFVFAAPPPGPLPSELCQVASFNLCSHQHPGPP